MMIFKYLLLLGLLYGLASIYAYFISGMMLFPKPRASYGPADDYLKLKTPQGVEIAARYYPNPEAEYILLYSHGNAEDVGTVDKRAKVFREHGWAVMTYDYPGYGMSSGKPTPESVYLSIFAAYDYILKELGYAPGRVVLYGYSLGGAASCELASKEKVGGLILESTFESAFRIYWYSRILPWDIFRNKNKIPLVDAPVLIIHGTEDAVVPFGHGPGLYARASEPKAHLWVDGAGHGDVQEVAGDAYWYSIARFKDRLSDPVILKSK